MTTHSLSSVIVDDERLAREELRRLLGHYPSISIDGEADSVQTAVQEIRSKQPDVLFLDIQLAGESGFDVLNQIHFPFDLVFVTAYDEYAIRAFDVNAIDYLLKPVNPKRLDQTVNRLLQDKKNPDESSKTFCYADSVFIKTSRSYQYVRIQQMVCIVAEGDYSRVILADGDDIITLKSMKSWECCLPPSHFCRIHRSTMMNLQYVQRIEPWFSGAYKIHADACKEELILSRRYAARLKDKFQL